MIKEWDRHYKNIVRSVVMSRTPKTSILTLPGCEARCCIEGFKNKMLRHKKTDGILVECNPKAKAAAEAVLADSGHEFRRLHWHAGYLHDLKIPWDIDFAFLDYTNPLTVENSRWMERTTWTTSRS